MENNTEKQTGVSEVAAETTRVDEFSKRFVELQTKYKGTPMDMLMGAYQDAAFGGLSTFPDIQNRRVKQINSLPHKYSKDQITNMLCAPDGQEQPLREVASILEYTAYPEFKLRKTLQDVLTYRWYNFPLDISEEEAKSEKFLREYRLVEKVCKSIYPSEVAHRIAGQALVYGKVHYYARYDVDKSHNKVNYAFMQQLPQDWVKIVGFNSVSKYTVAFNMMYFTQPGTSTAQFGDLFDEYVLDFKNIVQKKTDISTGNKNIKLNFDYLKKLADNQSKPNAYTQNGKNFYWVVLPVDKIWTFEIDDVWVNSISPFAGLFMSMAQIAQYEQVQLQLVQNPLVSLLTGEIPYADTKDATQADLYKLSPAGRTFWETLFYQMLDANNTSGIGIFLAPASNLKLQQLAEAPSSTDVSSKGYAYTMMKSGSGIIPASTEPRVGMVNVSAGIESRFAQAIYRTFEKMMRHIYSTLNLNWEWDFKMFGDIFSEKDEIRAAKDGMTLGILSDTLKYLAIQGLSLVDDLSISNTVIGIGILDKRLPLVSTYSAKVPEGALPPHTGRPKKESKDVNTEGQEQDVDDLGE